MTDPSVGTPGVPGRGESLENLLRELPPEHRAFVECLDTEREEQVRAAERHGAALERLQEASVAIARVLERGAIERELARHAARLTGAEGALVASGSGEALHIAVHWRGNEFTTAAAPHAVTDAVAAVGASGRLVRNAEQQVVALPLRTGHRSDGVLAVYGFPRADVFEMSGLLATLGATATAALGTAAVVAESVRDKRQSEALAELARALGSSNRLGEVLHLGLRHSCGILGTEGADIALVRGDYLHVVAAVGCCAPSQGVYTPLDESASGRAMREVRALVVNEITPDVRANPQIRELARVEKFVSVPMQTPDGPIGVLSVVNREADFGPDDVRVLSRLGSQLAVAVVKVRLFEEAQEATRELRAAFDAIAGGMAVVDADGFIVRHNARLGVITGGDDSTVLIGHSLYEVVLGESRIPAEDDPVGSAIIRRVAGRGTMRPRFAKRVFEVIASPHPQGGAVVTVDDVTSFVAMTERYRLVVESTSDAILITDAAGTIIFANDAAAALFGRDVASGGLRLESLVAESARATVRDVALRAMEGHSGHIDTEIERPNGERRVVSVSVAPVKDTGTINSVVVSLRDATEESHARAAMAIADSRYRSLFESASDAIFTLDATGVITSANLACAGTGGLPHDAIIGRRLLALVDPVDAGTAANAFGTALAGRSIQFECSVSRTDGSARLMSFSFSPLVAASVVTGVLGIARDVTDERAQAAALDRAEMRYARLVEQAEDGICTLDEEGRITSANRAFRRIVRVTRAEVRNRHFADLLPQDQRAMMWSMFSETLGGARRRAEIQFVSHLGIDSVVSVSTAPLMESDKVVGALAIVRDMTEERGLYERAARQDKLAALGELVGGVAHEVNSPLTSILAYGQLLQADLAQDSDARRAVDTVVSEARRAARIVGKLLTFARQNSAELVPTDINQVVLDTLDLRRYPLRMQEVRLAVSLAEGLPLVWADPFQLQQVFINLLSNAEQAVVAGGGPERRIEVSSDRRDGHVVVSVTDSGDGIAPEHLPHIFNPFYTTKPKGIGTGLGLAISFGIVREHGGFIQASTLPGGGATFTVHLPIRDRRTPAPVR